MEKRADGAGLNMNKKDAGDFLKRRKASELSGSTAAISGRKFSLTLRNTLAQNSQRRKGNVVSHPATSEFALGRIGA